MRRRIAGVAAGLTAMGGLVIAVWTEPSLAGAASAISHLRVTGWERIPAPAAAPSPNPPAQRSPSALIPEDDPRENEECEDEAPEQEGLELDGDANGEKEGHEPDRGDTCPSPQPTPTPTPSPFPTPSPTPTSGSPDLQPISVTVPNAIVRVYECSPQGTRCNFDFAYQLNPPFDPQAPTVYNNRYVTGDCAGDGEERVGLPQEPHGGGGCKPHRPRLGGREHHDHHRDEHQVRLWHRHP